MGISRPQQVSPVLSALTERRSGWRAALAQAPDSVFSAFDFSVGQNAQGLFGDRVFDGDIGDLVKQIDLADAFSR